MANDRYFDRHQDQYGRGDMDRGSRMMRDDDRDMGRESHRDDMRDLGRESYREGGRSSFMSRDPMNRVDDDRSSASSMGGRSAYNDLMRGGSYNERSGMRGGYGSDSGYSSGFGLGAGSNFGADYDSSFDNRGQRFTRSGEFAGRGPKGYQRADDRIREDVCETLMRHPEIDPSEIEIEVKQGEVWLRGHVDERRQKRLAEDVIENLSGVRDVHNEIRVMKGEGLMSRMADAIGLGDDERTKSSMKPGGKSTSPSNNARV